MCSVFLVCFCSTISKRVNSIQEKTENLNPQINNFICTSIMSFTVYKNALVKVHYGSSGGAYVNCGDEMVYISPKKMHGNDIMRTYIFDDKHISKTFRCKLTRLAQEQKANFKDIFPWDCRFNQNKTLMIVTTMKDPDTKDISILGWMTCDINRKNNEVYIRKVSSRSAIDTQYKGIAYKMFQRMKHYICMISMDNPIIYLYPLNAKVSITYVKWGFEHVDLPTGYLSKNMYFVEDPMVKKLLTDERLDELEPEQDKKEHDHVYDELSEAQSSYMKKLLEQDPQRYGEVYMELEGLIAVCGCDKDILEGMIEDLLHI